MTTNTTSPIIQSLASIVESLESAQGIIGSPVLRPIPSRTAPNIMLPSEGSIFYVQGQTDSSANVLAFNQYFKFRDDFREKTNAIKDALGVAQSNINTNPANADWNGISNHMSQANSILTELSSTTRSQASLKDIWTDNNFSVSLNNIIDGANTNLTTAIQGITATLPALLPLVQSQNINNLGSQVNQIQGGVSQVFSQQQVDSGTLNAVNTAVGTTIPGTLNTMQSGIAGLQGTVQTRMDGMGSKLDGINTAVSTNIPRTLDTMQSGIKGLQTGITGLQDAAQTGMSTLGSKLDTMNAGIGSIQTAVGPMTTIPNTLEQIQYGIDGVGAQVQSARNMGMYALDQIQGGITGISRQDEIEAEMLKQIKAQDLVEAKMLNDIKTQSQQQVTALTSQLSQAQNQATQAQKDLSDTKIALSQAQDLANQNANNTNMWMYVTIGVGVVAAIFAILAFMPKSSEPSTHVVVVPTEKSQSKKDSKKDKESNKK